MRRGENAVRAHAVRGPEPRVLELETPRPLGATRANRAEAVEEQKVTNIKNKSKNKNTGNGENGIVPLNVWAENPNCAEAVVWRADTVKLLPALKQVDLLLRLAKSTRVLINREHKRRRLLYKQSGIIDCSLKGAYWNQDYAQLKELIGSKNLDEALCLVSRALRAIATNATPLWYFYKVPESAKTWDGLPYYSMAAWKVGKGMLVWGGMSGGDEMRKTAITAAVVAYILDPTLAEKTPPPPPLITPEKAYMYVIAAASGRATCCARSGAGKG